MTIPIPSLCLVTDRNRCGGRCIEEVVGDAISGGVDMVQLREKDLPAADLYHLAMRLRDISQGRALLIVNDRVDVAIACNADGVQIGESGLPTDAVRSLVGKDVLIGRSVHSLERALKAQESGADFLVLGTIFPTGSHPGEETAGISLVSDVCSKVTLPVLAIGGITPSNIVQVVEAGACGASVITAITLHESPTEAAHELKSEMASAWRRRSTERIGRPL